MANFDLRDIAESINAVEALPAEELRELTKIVNRIADLDRMDEAQNKFIPFVKHVWPGFIEGAHHRVMADAFERVASGKLRRLIINMPPRHDLVLTCPVLTTDGWTTVGDLRVGQRVFGPDGCPTMVIGKSEVKIDEPVWEVETTDGHVIECSGGHLWTASMSMRSSGNRRFHTMSTEEWFNRAPRHGPYLPDFKPIVMPYSELPIDPYVLGLWIGDGSKRDGSIGCSFSDMYETRRNIENCGYKTTHNENHQKFNVLGLITNLRDAGVLLNKHIPDAYFVASEPQRLRLLQGLIDSDGCISKNGRVTFHQTDRHLIEQVCSLVIGLGAKARITSRRTNYKGKASRESYRINFRLPGCATLKRKAERLPGQISCRGGRSIKIRKTDRRASMQCIKIAREDGLWLAGSGMVVQHNTKSEFASHMLPAWFLGKYPNKKVIQSSHTAELSKGFGRKVRDLVSSPEFQQIFPGVALKKDSTAAARWETNHKGEYFAVGVGGSVAGRGADLFIIDDSVSEQEGKSGDPRKFDEVYDWYETGPRQRLQPGGAIIIVECVAEGERVLMADGTWKAIEDISEGEFVVSCEDRYPVSRKVVASRCSGEDDIVEVVSRSCSLKVNRNHPFLVVDGGLKVSAKNQEDVIQSRNWNLKWKRAGDLVPGDTVVTQKSISTSNHRPMSFVKNVQMTMEDYQFIGFMFGDGWIIRSKNRGIVGCAFAASDHYEVDGYYLNIAERRYGLKPKLTKFGYYSVDSTDFGRWLEKIGMSGNAHTKRVPDWVFRLRPCDKRQFLLGFFSADGWLRPSSTAETYSVGLCNRDLLDDLRLLSRTCGVKTTKIYEHSGSWKAPNSKCEKIHLKFTSRFSMKESKTELRSRYKNQGDMGLNYRFEDIEYVRPCGRSRVYDLTVDGSENFVAEGFVVHNTRWNKSDLSGRVIRKAIERDGVDEWEVIELPAILPSGKALWPGFWSLSELKKIKSEISPFRWSAQYMQSPTSDELSIIKREWWKKWTEPEPPECSYIIQSWDTAFTKKTRSDYSACTTWGVFHTGGVAGTKKIANLILLDAFRDRLEFPALKEIAFQKYKRYNPDSLIIETRSAGYPLIHELRERGVYVTEYTPSRGEDKHVRINAVSDLFASGVVWAPDREFADEVIQEFSDFPAGDHDDYVDSGTQALMRFRHGGFIPLGSDEFGDDEPFVPIRAAYY